MNGMFKRILAVFLVLTVLFATMSAAVFAADGESEGTDPEESQEESNEEEESQEENNDDDESQEENNDDDESQIENNEEEESQEENNEEEESQIENNEEEESQVENNEEEEEADSQLLLQPFAASYVLFAFELTEAAVAGTSTYPGATIQVETSQYTSSDYFTSYSTSSTYMAYSDTQVDFVINYLSRLYSNDGSGIGKITGSFDVDLNGDITNVTAVNVVGGSVTTSITGTGTTTQKIRVTNPTANASVEWTSAMQNRIAVSPTPSDASFDLFDGRDGSRIPIYGVSTMGPLWALPVPKQNLATNTVQYVVERSGYDTATGEIEVTRTSISLYDHSLTLVPDGSEVSASLDTVASPAYLYVELKKQSVDYGITFSIKSATAATVTMTMDEVTLSPSASSKYRYDIPLVSMDTVVDYEISAPEFKTVRGQLKLKPDGGVEDITDQAAKNGTVSYFFDAPAQQLNVEMLPSVIGTPSNIPGLYEAEVFGLFDNIFASGSTLASTMLTGGLAQGGRLEVTNPDPDYRTVITGVRVEGYASMSHNVLRISTPITRYFTDEAPATVGEYMRVRDIVEYANEKFSGNNFKTYYDCVLYYMQNEAGYSNISSLDDLDLDGLQIIFSSLAMGVGNYTMDLTGYDDAEGDIDYNNTGSGVLLESENRIQALALKLLNEYALYFSLDDTITGVLPMSSDNLSAYEGLQFNDYLKNTDANKAQVARMINGIVLDAGGSYVFENISFSTIGSYLWNHFYINGLVFDFTLYFNMSRVGIDGVVFEDANENGVYDGGESVYEGVAVRLYAADNLTTPLDTTTTDSDGYYLFNDINILQSGNYVVQIDIPDGKTVTILGTTGTEGDNVFAQNTDGKTANCKTINYVVNTNARANAGLKSAGGTTNPKYIVTYNANGGTGSHQDAGLEYGSSYVMLGRPETGITRDGYTFKGWNTRADGSGTSYAADDKITITGDVTLYAQWEKTSSSNETDRTNNTTSSSSKTDKTNNSRTNNTITTNNTTTTNDTTTTDDTTGTIADNPSTGNASNLPLVSLLCVSLAAIVFLLWVKRRKKTAAEHEKCRHGV